MLLFRGCRAFCQGPASPGKRKAKKEGLKILDEAGFKALVAVAEAALKASQAAAQAAAPKPAVRPAAFPSSSSSFSTSSSSATSPKVRRAAPAAKHGDAAATMLWVDRYAPNHVGDVLGNQVPLDAQERHPGTHIHNT